MATSDASLQIGDVTLIVHDLPAVAQFYEKIIGLERIFADAAEIALGVEGQVMVRLCRDVQAARTSPREAGLFHTAFLLPERSDLGAFLAHLSKTGQSLEGASDHKVSEALYLSDPEGNGVEIYRDRLRAEWPFKNGEIAMTTDPIDLQDVTRAAQADWRGAPAGTVIGHVHLRVGALDPAEVFYRDMLGLPVTTRYPGANFHGWDGYHHHIATNIWHSKGAAPKTSPRTGLAEVGLRGTPEALEALVARAGANPVDPWGLPFVLRETETAPA